MADDGRHAVVCNRVASGPAPILSEQGTCSACGCGIWLAPSTAQYLRAHPDAVPFCVRCYTKWLQRRPNEVIELRMPPGAADEIAAARRAKENH